MDNKYLAAIVIFSTITLALCNKPKWKVCDETAKYEATISGVDVSATVDASGEIHLKKGTNVTVSFNFKMTSGTAKQIKAVVHGVIAGVPVPFPLNNPDACKGCGLTCPITAPNAFDYKSVIPVKKDYPNLRLAVKWELKDGNGKEIWCALMPAVIES